MVDEGIVLSASQIQLFRECERKWAWRYVAGIRPPATPAQALGVEVEEEQLQPLLSEGRPLDDTKVSGRIAAAGLRFLPTPKTEGMQLQKKFQIPSLAAKDLSYLGYIDCFLPRAEDRAPLIIDFKTTSNIKRWAKSPEALSLNVQAMLYAMAVTLETNARIILLDWIYFQTKEPYKASISSLFVDAEHIVNQYKKIDETGIQIRDTLIANKQPLDLTPNPDMCSQYGGCPYQSNCNLSPIVHQLKRNPMASTSEMLAKLKANRAAAAGPPVPVELPTWAKETKPFNGYNGQKTPAINPPEAEIVAEAQAAVDKVASELPVVLDPPKKKRGRPRKVAEAPMSPEASAALEKGFESAIADITSGRPLIDHDFIATPEQRAEAKRAYNEACGVEPITPIPDVNELTTFEVTFGAERHVPEPYAWVDVGPFKVIGEVRPGETLDAAMKRAYGELEAFAQIVGARKLAAYKAKK